MIMKKFISFLIALFAILTIQAQQYSLDKTFINTCVVQQHIDVGVVFQTTFNNIYISQTFSPGVAITSAYYNPIKISAVYTNNYLSNTSYTTQYRRGVGLINDYTNYNYVQTNNLIQLPVYSQNNYQNVQKYYCNN